MGNQPIIKDNASPPQVVTPFPGGANSPMTAGIVNQQNATIKQMELIGKSGGSNIKSKPRKLKKYMKGGVAPVIQVTPVPSGSLNQAETTENYTQLAGLANKVEINSTYDTAKTPAQTAQLQQQQQNIYNGKGGSKKYRRSSKNRRSRKGKKGRKNNRTKRRHH
jgi:hypothetical protein